jgi:hypothetical protein
MRARYTMHKARHKVALKSFSSLRFALRKVAFQAAGAAKLFTSFELLLPLRKIFFFKWPLSDAFASMGVSKRGCLDVLWRCVMPFYNAQ